MDFEWDINDCNGKSFVNDKIDHKTNVNVGKEHTDSCLIDGKELQHDDWEEDGDPLPSKTDETELQFDGWDNDCEEILSNDLEPGDNNNSKNIIGNRFNNGRGRGARGNGFNRQEYYSGEDTYQRRNENKFDDWSKGKSNERNNNKFKDWSYNNRNEDSRNGRESRVDRERGGRYVDNRGGRNQSERKDNDGKREFYIPPEPTDDESEIFSTCISSGINFDKYDKIPVNISGENVPEPVTSFENAGLREFLLINIKKSGYEKPTPVQKYSIPIIMEGRDLMGCAQTGSGKTAAFLLPILNRLITDNKDLSIGKPQVLIISPTRELANQIYLEARKFSLGSFLKISLVYGGPSVKYQGDNISKGCHILVATPGRLLHFMNLGFITFEDIRFVVLDEADRMLDMGFIPDMERVMEDSTMPQVGERQTIMFSATFPDDIQRLAGKFLHDYIFLAVGTVGSACTDVEQKFYKVNKFKKRLKLMELLESGAKGTIVFVETKRNADFLASLLSETKFPTTSIHGDRRQREREMALNDFKAGRMDVLIATSVAARGLDIKNVEHVVNYDLPKSIDDYVHRIGRTGRVGNYGKASSFYDPEEDSNLAADLVKILRQANQEVPDFLLNIGGGSKDFERSYNNKFGGRDIRNDDDDFGTNSYEPSALEPEEEW